MKAIRNRSQLERMMIRALLAHFDSELKAAVRFARNGTVYSPVTAELERLLLPYLVQGALLGMNEGLGPLLSLGMGFDVALVNEAAVAFAKQFMYSGYDVGLAEAITAHSRAVVQREVSAWLATGDKIDELIAALEPTFGRARAQTIAVTEVTNAIAGGNVAAWREVNRQFGTDVITAMSWSTANDERVCFPAWTMVETETGAKPIQAITTGDMVWTRQGLRRVIATSKRDYSGNMVTVKTDTSTITSTSDHPYWTLEKGWLQGRNLNPGHTLQTFGNQSIGVSSVSEFVLGNTHNVPSPLGKKLVFAGVPSGLMPIISVNFERHTVSGKQEINAISTHPGLLREFNTHAFERQPDITFQKVFTSKLSIAREAAKLPRFRFLGFNSEFIATVAARLKNWRTAASLRTKSWCPSHFAAFKRLAASFTDIFFVVDRSAFPTTHSEFVCFAAVDNERLATDGANLRHFVSPIGIVALTSAERSADSGGAVVKLNTAFSAINTLTRSFSLGFAELQNMIIGRHIAHLLSSFIISHRRLFANPVTVYNLEVEEHHEFYANGILVHNCPICAPLGGLAFGDTAEPASRERQERRAVTTDLTTDLTTPFTHPGGKGAAGKFEGVTYERPPAHPRCRCTLVPVLS